MQYPPFLTHLPLASSGTLTVRHYRSGTPLQISWDHSGLLTSLSPASSAGEESVWIAPGLLDLQVNGYAGVDLQSEDAISAEALLHLTRSLARDGCRRVLLTLITAPWDMLLDKVRRFRAIIQANAELRQSIVGWHIEGPFLSDQPGFRGAHNAAWMCDPTPGHIRQLRATTQGDPVLLTLAPERAGTGPAIEEAVRSGIKISLGHSDASTAQLRMAAECGASGFTHLGNGCAQTLDRHNNILWRVMNEEALTAGLIPDGIHLSPDLFRILHRALPAQRIYWTTDAMSAAGAPPGNYRIGEVEVTVGEDQVVRNPTTGGFAGSALTPIEGIRRGAQMLGTHWSDVWDYFSAQPARFLGLPHALTPGSPAGFCLLRST